MSATLDDIIPDVQVPLGEQGRWAVRRFVITEEDAKWAALRDGWRAPRPGVYTKLCHCGAVIMSDTPAEKLDHLEFVRRARGRILINGLGLGMVLAAALRKPDVEFATVIEASEDVIALVAQTYANDPRVEIILADAYEWKPPKGTVYDAVWHDIWPDICADNLDGMKRLHRRYGSRAKWQGSWARDLCERYARHGR